MPTRTDHEFILGECPDAPGFFDCAGIESPGLSSAPAIGEYTAQLLQEKLSLAENTDFVATRTGILDPKTLSREDYNALIARDPAYGRIICRCEQRHRRGDRRRNPSRPRRTQPRRREAPHPRGHGPLSGGLLLAEGDGHSGAGARRGTKRRSQNPAAIRSC